MNRRLIASLGLLAVMAFAASAYADDSEGGPLRKLFKKDKEEPKKKINSHFAQFWYDSNADWDRLKKINVSNVDVSKLADDPAWKAAGDAKSAQYSADAQKLADSMKESFCDELKARGGNSWKLTESPDDETAVLHLSITKITPPKDAFAPSQVQAEESQPAIAMEGRLVDKKTGSEIMKFSDSKSFTQGSTGEWFGNSKDILKSWGGSFAEMSMPDAEKAEKEHSRLRKVGRMIGMHFAIRKFME